MNKIYWIANDKGGEMGSYPTREAAEKFINESGFLPKDRKWTVVEKEVTTCPTCNQPAEKDIVEGLGECLRCDHVRGDIEYDRLDEEEYDE